jgi:hypothetical protein
MLFGLVYGHLALARVGLLFHSVFLLAVGLVWLCSYAILARRYWFSLPFTGICLSLACFVASIVAAYA